MRRASDPRGRGTSAWVTAVRERTFKTPTEKLMMMVLCDYINADDEAWPGNMLLAEDVGVEVNTIKRSLARLEDAGVIERVPLWHPKPDQKYPTGGRVPDVIRFLWEGFQQLPLTGHPTDKMSPNLEGLGDIKEGVTGHSGGGVTGHSHVPDLIKNPLVDNPPERGRRCRLPQPFEVTAAMAGWALDKFPSVDWAGQTEQFVDYHLGKGSVMVDWPAAWRTWIRNAGTRFAPRGTTNGRAPVAKVDLRFAESMARADAMEAKWNEDHS